MLTKKRLVSPVLRWQRVRGHQSRQAPCGENLNFFRDIHIKVDNRNRLSSIWAPTGGVTASKDSQNDGHALLLRAGFLRQAYAGVFHLLPLGLRVQDKIERLIDKHMRSLGASKLSLSSITSEALWRKSGRLTGDTSELLRLNARSGPGFLLSPTHEEEITSLVANSVTSYKDLPIRLYQVSRKYRDERRPRQGLLRTREFLMKDLYTFDVNDELALNTYHSVKKAYDAFFDELRIPYLVATADSGSIGGDYSHEYHFVTSIGEDNIISCDSCVYVANEELAEKGHRAGSPPIQPQNVQTWLGVTQDGETLVKAYYPSSITNDKNTTSADPPNTFVLKKIVPTLDSGVEDPLKSWKPTKDNPSTGLDAPEHQTAPTSAVLHIFDRSLAAIIPQILSSNTRSPPATASEQSPQIITNDAKSGRPLDLVRIRPGDPCPQCAQGTLKVDRAVELGHTFHLGTRYSTPLDASVVLSDGKRVPMSMGCHGIGISRMIGAVASIMADGKGLNWPRVIAPYEVVVVPGKGLEADAVTVYDSLSVVDDHGMSIDVALDDRSHDMGWKLNDADLIGYPIIVVLGRGWKQKRECEVQCRQLGGLRVNVPEADVRHIVMELLGRLSTGEKTNESE